jgi:hypothetical protein
MRGQTGAAMTTHTGTARARRNARRRRREEASWAARNGPVTVKFVDPEQLRSQGTNGNG